MPTTQAPKTLRMKVTFNVSYEYNQDGEQLTRQQAIEQAKKALDNLFSDVDPSLYDEDTEGLCTVSCGHAVALSR